MIRKLLVNGFLGLGLLHSALLASACSSDSGPGSGGESVSATGTLSMPLVASAGSHSYRLQGGMYVNGPSFQFLDLSAAGSVVSTTLPTGDYSAFLYNWTLTRDDGSGSFVPVVAQLTSSSNPTFSVYKQTTTTISFQFETDGQIVTVGAGQLDVAIGVHEATSVCTPLGSDCPADSWCAPTELTGAALRCVPAGSAALGEACNAPSDCQANSSCYDVGAGAVCLQLCTGAEFGQACDASSQCTPSGTDYGVCLPNAGAAG